MKFLKLIIILVFILTSACERGTKGSQSTSAPKSTSNDDPFPPELVDFKPIADNPIFTGTGKDTWDKHIRERGFILLEDDKYHMWYTGFDNSQKGLALGYAYSDDGISWMRYDQNPIFSESWTEDMMVIKVNGVYYMFAEGKHDIAHWLTSNDRVNWTDQGTLDIRQTSGKPLSSGPYGTPTVWFENDIWYLFYERNDQGIWLATSKDLKTWTNIDDDPVIEMRPEPYDKYGLAVNQIIKYKDWYYAYYHGTAFEDWREWTTNVAVSKDLVNWKKYEMNPILKENKSSGILVHDGKQFRMYTMHDKVALHFPADK